MFARSRLSVKFPTKPSQTPCTREHVKRVNCSVFPKSLKIFVCRRTVNRQPCGQRPKRMLSFDPKATDMMCLRDFVVLLVLKLGTALATTWINADGKSFSFFFLEKCVPSHEYTHP